MSRSEGARDQLIRGVASAKAGETELARRYIERALHLGPDQRQRVDAHYWLAKLAEDPDDKRDHLIRVLQLEPAHYAARRDLALLDGELREAEWVDPADPKPLKPPPPRVAGRRYLCAQCGGRLEYDPESAALKCSYCGYRADQVVALQQGAAAPESDFIHALVTAKGHTYPQQSPTFTCQACGAVYLLGPGTLSLTCPHCGSVYAVKRLNAKNLVPPKGIIPFKITEDQASARLREWLKDQRVRGAGGIDPVYGLYLPAWTFDISGEAPFTYRERQGDDWVERRGSRLLMRDDLPVAASHRLPKRLAEEVHNYDLSELQSYDPSVLAGWPAEAYEISATDAAMAARWRALDELRGRTRRELGRSVTDLRFRSASLVISAYRLVLLPFWLTEYQADGRRQQAAVNGQTGAVRAERPSRSWWARFLDFFGS